MKKITLVAWSVLILGYFGLIAPAFAGPDAPYQTITDKFAKPGSERNFF